MALESRVNLSSVMNVARCKHIQVIERWKTCIATRVADDRISQRSDTPVTHANDQRRRTSTRSVRRLAVVITVTLFALMSLSEPGLAREKLLREDLEAWWSQLQARKDAARKTCAESTAPGCGRHQTARSRTGGAEAMTQRDASAHATPHRSRTSRHERGMTANARAEARDNADSSDRRPRRDRPGRYFLHGPRF
ncbi:hypothetical protein [Bradyrhizobium sp. SZCCHNR2011]|uniref:hypothetical protein n=1 Tax=Bradyrhizobium sp. SZCCHNR2011 TaxID=3057376 RepID=UPI0028F00607|nr:hypothetical protein [Bradyrhizobium sp. SZCCHNR2011]